MHKLDEVFGISRALPLNYIARENVDDTLKECLNRKQHIVIYGSSKQGKTCLRKKCLLINSFITIHCSNRLEIADLNQQILKEAGFEVTISHNKTISGKAKAKASFGFNFLTKIIGEGEVEGGIENETIKQALELDLDDTNDIIRALDSIKFSKYIIFDDFHYLKPQTQKDFAFALKAYYEKSDYIFIVIGVWLEKTDLLL